jgi:hypothetical protein
MERDPTWTSEPSAINSPFSTGQTAPVPFWTSRRLKHILADESRATRLVAGTRKQQ